MSFQTLRAKFETNEDSDVASKTKYPKSPLMSRKKNPSSDAAKSSKSSSKSTLSAPNNNPTARAPSPARPPRNEEEHPKQPIRSNSGSSKSLDPPRGRQPKSSDVGKSATLPPRSKSPKPKNKPPPPRSKSPAPKSKPPPPRSKSPAPKSKPSPPQSKSPKPKRKPSPSQSKSSKPKSKPPPAQSNSPAPPLPPRTDALPSRTNAPKQPPSRQINDSKDRLAPKKNATVPSKSDDEDRSEDISEAVSDVPDHRSDNDEEGKSSMNVRTAKRRTTRKMKKKNPRPEKVPPPYVPPRKPTYTKRDEVVIQRSKTKPGPPLPSRADVQISPVEPASDLRPRSKSSAGHIRKKNLAPKQDAKVMQRRASAESEIRSAASRPSITTAPITSAPPPLTSAPPPIMTAPPKLPTAPPPAPGDNTISRKSTTVPPAFTPAPPKETATRTPSLTPSYTGEEQLGLDNDQSEYEDDDDIYGQIAADLDDISYDQDFIVVQKDATPAPQQTTKSGFREYWHERKEVIESGILEGDQISKDERARQEAMYEVLTSEQTYKKSLETLEKQFINDNLFTCYLDDETDIILGNIHEIISINKRMLEELKSLYEGKVTVDSITEVIKSFVDHQFSSYVTYCANTSDQQYILSQRRLEDTDFDMFLTGREKALAGQNLQSYLLLPMQRVTRMPLLLSAIFKKTDDNSPDKAPLEALLNDVTAVVNKCNEGVRRAETRRHMADLEKKCDFSKIKKHMSSFTDKPERLIVREELVYILKFKSGKMMGSKINMWLFTDCLVIGLTDPKDESKTMLTEYSPRQLIKIVPHFFPPSSYKKKLEPERIFHLQLLSPDKKFIIQCQSANDKAGWLEALKKKENENEDETVYEEWDVPLVQARHHYEKINDDDLELAEGEICRVLKKYTDGWCFGQRESDGQQGWFPMSFMVEIDSDHAKYREIIKKQQLLDIVASNKKAAEFFSTMKKD
ncbi:hypothetical protein ACHWQZ_G005850 [Mnemiopsis leidyi]